MFMSAFNTLVVCVARGFSGEVFVGGFLWLWAGVFGFFNVF
jgi:hypothetical protein